MKLCKKRIIALFTAVTILGGLLTGCASGSDSNKAPESKSDEKITFKMSMVDNETTNYYKGAKKEIQLN